MSVLSHELEMLHNPALGAAVLWHFIQGYTVDKAKHTAVPLPLCALVLPTIWHKETLDLIVSTQVAKGLRAFTDKFSDSKNSRYDILLSLNARSKRWRSKTMEALKMGLGTGLFKLELEGYLTSESSKIGQAKWANSVEHQFRAASKLGIWFSTLSVKEVAAILHVKF